MARRIFIVARGNVAVYQSLTQALRREQDVEIIFDRRRDQPRRSDFGDALKKVFSRRTPLPSTNTKEERRQQARIDEQIRTQGWAVVRDETPELGVDPAASTQYKKLRSVWSDQRLRQADPMLAVLLEHRGICLDCLAEKVKLSLDEVMAGLRRTQGTALLAFVTRACVVCSRKSLVSYVRDSAVVHGPGALADSGKAEAVDDDHTDCADVEVRPIGSRQDDPEDGACAMSVSRLGQRSSTVTSGAFGESAGRHSNDGFRGDHRSTAPAADLPELHGRTLVLQAEDDVLDPAPRPEAALDRRDLQHVGMILKLADAQGTGESHA